MDEIATSSTTAVVDFVAEVAWPDCGNFELSRAQFDQAEAEITESDES